MSENRPFVLTIAGLDPSGGAGILADIKTFEQHKVAGFAISTANTIQTENTFYEIQWTDLSFVIRSYSNEFNGNDVLIDDIWVRQIPKACGNEIEIPVVINTNGAFNVPTPGIVAVVPTL